jgi:hypothetical protein
LIEGLSLKFLLNLEIFWRLSDFHFTRIFIQLIYRMAYRRALATGLRRLSAHAAGSSAVAEAVASTELPVVSRMLPSALQFTRSFAAQPAAAPEVGVGKVTQVCF